MTLSKRNKNYLLTVFYTNSSCFPAIKPFYKQIQKELLAGGYLIADGKEFILTEKGLQEIEHLIIS